MLRKMDVVMSDFKIKLFKAQGNYNKLPYLPHKKFCCIISAPDRITWTRVGWGEG